MAKRLRKVAPASEPAPVAPERIEYPKCVYQRNAHDGLEVRTVQSAAELEALGDGWADSPPKPKG